MEVATVGVFAIVQILFFGLFIVVGLGGTALWIWMLIDCAQNEPSDGNDKIVWILVIVFAGALGALIYLLVRRPQRVQEAEAPTPRIVPPASNS